MSQKEIQKENSQKSVLTQIQNQVSSQGEFKSHAQSQDEVPSQAGDSQAICFVASQAQLESQTVSSQATVASQGQTQSQLASQQNVSTQAQSISSQPIVPPMSQLSSQRSVSSSQGAKDAKQKTHE